jgi:hypothetical protein
MGRDLAKKHRAPHGARGQSGGWSCRVSAARALAADFGTPVRFDRVEKVLFERPWPESGRNVRGRFVVERVGTGTFAGKSPVC